MQAGGNIWECIKKALPHLQKIDSSKPQTILSLGIYTFFNKANYGLISENKGFMLDLLMAARVHV